MDEIDRIAELYESTLILPDVKPSPQFDLVPVGLVGSGKTPIIKELAKRLNLLRISGDEIRKIIDDEHSDPENAWEIGRQLIYKYTSLGYSIAHDADGAPPKTQAAIAKKVEQYGIKVIWIHINPPEEYILEKLRKYPGGWLFKDADDAIAMYRSRKQYHQHFPMEFAYVFDPSRPDIDKQLDEAATAIRSKLNV